MKNRATTPIMVKTITGPKTAPASFKAYISDSEYALDSSVYIGGRSGKSPSLHKSPEQHLSWNCPVAYRLCCTVREGDLHIKGSCSSFRVQPLVTLSSPKSQFVVTNREY